MAKRRCNFCEFSSGRYGCGSEQHQDREAGLRKDVEKLRSLIMRMTGRDDDASSSELLLLIDTLEDVKRIVLDQKKKVELEEDERLREQKKAEDEDDRTRRRRLREQEPPFNPFQPKSKMYKQEKKKAEDDGARKEVSDPCKSSTSSTEDRQKKQDDGASMSNLVREFERRKSESLESELQRLWLFNERMNGREIENMTSSDLRSLGIQILYALCGLRNQRNQKTRLRRGIGL